MSDDCLFCKIINGDIPAEIIKETEYVCAFRDINPQAKTHVLIIPKKHIVSTRELDNDNIEYLSKMVFWQIKSLRKKVLQEMDIAGWSIPVMMGDRQLIISICI